MAKTETSASFTNQEHHDIERIRNFLKIPKQNYIGPAYLISEDGIVPIAIIGDLGEIDEPSGKRHRFAAQLDLPTVKNRIQGGLWNESVGIPKARHILQRRRLKLGRYDHIAQQANPNENLMPIPDGYHGPAVIVDGMCRIPVYVGGLGELTGENHVRANLMFPDVRRRLEGEIDANKVHALSWAVGRYTHAKKEREERV